MAIDCRASGSGERCLCNISTSPFPRKSARVNPRWLATFPTPGPRSSGRITRGSPSRLYGRAVQSTPYARRVQDLCDSLRAAPCSLEHPDRKPVNPRGGNTCAQVALQHKTKPTPFCCQRWIDATAHGPHKRVRRQPLRIRNLRISHRAQCSPPSASDRQTSTNYCPRFWNLRPN